MMAPRVHPPSSPTPHASSVAAPPLTAISKTPDRRTLIRAVPSTHKIGLPSYGASGHISASGLTTWRRGKRPHNSGSGSSNETMKKGPGMGMQSTPARRKRARSTTGKSVGLQSTPTTSIRLAGPETSGSSSALSLSSLPDLDDTTFPSILITPDIDSPNIPAIVSRSQRDDTLEEDVFGIMTFIDVPPHSSLGSSSTSDTVFLHSRRGALLGPEEISVPVRFPSSESESVEDERPEEAEALLEAARQVILGQEGITHLDFLIPVNLDSSDAAETDQEDDAFEEGATVRPLRRLEGDSGDDESITHEDLQVTLDITDPSTSRRLTEVISRKSRSTVSSFAISKGGARVKNRQSTPYRISATTMRPFGEDDSETSTPTKPMTGHDVSSAFSMADMDRPFKGILLDILEQASNNIPSEDDHDPREVTEEARSQWSDLQTTVDHGLDGATEMSIAYEPCDQTPDFELTPPYTSRMNIETPPSSVISIPPLVRGRYSPVPFIPSSQLGTPLRSPCMSALTIDSIPSRQAGQETSSSPLTSLSSEGLPARPQRLGRKNGLKRNVIGIGERYVAEDSQDKAQWRGASIMARMSKR